MWYHVSEANSYLAITGAGIENVKIAKKAFVLPLQKVSHPSNHAKDQVLTDPSGQQNLHLAL
jgi:hypothetical protein